MAPDLLTSQAMKRKREHAMSNTTEMTALTEVEKDRFETLAWIVAGGYDGVDVGLIRATFDGDTEVAVLVSKHELEDGATALHPLAIMLDDGPLTDRLVPAGEGTKVAEGLMTTQGTSMSVALEV